MAKDTREFQEALEARGILPGTADYEILTAQFLQAINQAKAETVEDYKQRPEKLIPTPTNSELEKKINYIVRSNPAVVQTYDEAAMSERGIPALVEDIKALIHTETQAQLIQLIEGIIGEDEHWEDNHYSGFAKAIDGGESLKRITEAQNQLRATQRHRLEQASNNKKGERDE